jgi:AcrR family transcriptional regulator
MTPPVPAPAPAPVAGRSGAGTRARLLAAARELIEEGGYGAAPVTAIAGRAGVAAGTLYRHFASKEQLFVVLFGEVCAGEERAMRHAADAAAAPGEPGAGLARLQSVLATFADRALRNPRLAWALLAEPVDPLVDGERLAWRARYAGLVAGELRRAIAAGELPDQDPGLTAAALIGGCGEALVGPLSPVTGTGSRTAADRDRVVAALRTFAHRAVGAPGRP